MVGGSRLLGGLYGCYVDATERGDAERRFLVFLEVPSRLEVRGGQPKGSSRRARG